MLNLKNKKYCNHYTLCDIKFSTNPSQTFDSFDHAFPHGFNINTYEQLVKSAFHRSLLPNNYPSAANTEPERWAPSAIQLRFSQISTPHKTTYSIQLLSNKTPTTKQTGVDLELRPCLHRFLKTTASFLLAPKKGGPPRHSTRSNCSPSLWSI